MTVVDDLFSVLRSAPHLDNPACIGHHNIMDEYLDITTIEAAKAICGRCSCQPERLRHYLGLRPSLRPFGTTAGVCRRPRQSRQAKGTAA